MALSGDGDAGAARDAIGGFPTSALAVIRFDGESAESRARQPGYLEAFLTPADL